MLTFLQLVILFYVICLLAYYTQPMLIWIGVIGGILLLMSIFSTLSWWLLFPFWIVFITSIILLAITRFRLKYVSKPLLNYLRHAMPTMSQTEREALEAGGVGLEGDIFQGRLDWTKLLAKTKVKLTPLEQSFLDNEVETLCAMVSDWEIHKATELSQGVWDYIKKEGFLGLVIPTQYGGKGFCALAHSAILTKLASRSTSVAVSVMVPNSLGPAELLMRYGTQDQKDKLLPSLAAGKEIPCFALTAPEAGSDASAIPDQGVVCKKLFQGKETLGVEVSWDKRYITLAPIATLVGVAFQLFDPKNLLGRGKKEIGISLALIPASHPGVEIGKRHYPMDLGFMNGPTRGKLVFIPIEWLIGGEAMLGKGWQMLMECLSIGRSLSLPALSSAATQLCYRMCSAYARIRVQFNKPIGYFEGVQAGLARIGGYAYLLEAVRLQLAHDLTHGTYPAVASAIIKYHSTEISRIVVNQAMDIHGGRGIQFGPRNYLGLLYQALPIMITVEGANILTRNLIIFGQGALRCHPFLSEELAIANKPNQSEALEEFDKVLCKHIVYILRNFSRTFLYSLSGAWLVSVPRQANLTRYYAQLTRLSATLSFVADVALVLLGGKLKAKENLSARLGDVLSYLYLATATLRYYSANDCKPEDESYVHWVLQTCVHQAQEAFFDFFRNYPNRLIGSLLGFISFPFGRNYNKPNDKLDQQISESMLSDPKQRDRLTKHCYVSHDLTDSTGRMEVVFKKSLQAQRIEKKFIAARRSKQIASNLPIDEQLKLAVQKHLLTQAEAKTLEELYQLVYDAIQVDEFNPTQDPKKRTMDPQALFKSPHQTGKLNIDV